MGASIVLVGLGANVPNPGSYIELDFAQGPAGGYGQPRTILLLGNKTSAGTATNDTVVYGPDTQTPCQTEADVITLFGTGSQLHRMMLRATKVNPNATYYYVAVTSSTGANASATMTIATSATSNGNHRFWCVDEFVDTTINSGDSPTTIAANIVTSINGKSRWPVTASSSSGVVTITAREPGPEGNWIRVQALITPGASTIGTTTTLTSNGYLSGGTTADSIANALATVKPSRNYYTVVADSDATNIGLAVTQVNLQAQPTTGIRERVIAASVDTLANAITIATGLNAARAELVWGYVTDWTPAELAAYFAALYQLLEQGSPYGVARKNFSLFPSQPNDAGLWLIPGGRNGVGSAPTFTQITSALNNGLSPVTQLNGGTTPTATQFVKRCTTRSLNGSVADYRVRDAHKVSVCDYWCDDWQTLVGQQFGGKDLAPNPVQGQPAPPNTATYPAAIQGAAAGLVINYGNAGQWSYPPGVPIPTGATPADVINSLFIVQAETNPPTRCSVLAPLSPVNILDQVATLAQQVG